jgi:peptidoglycan/xylan/chitin deacetylase (PgdA/CDA1 family)
VITRSVLGALSPAGEDARLSVLMFHRVLPSPDPLFPWETDARRFDQICSWLAQWFDVLPLDKAVQRLRSGTLPRRAAAITFDDGYADNHDVALPILVRHRLPATIFIASGFVGGGRMFNDTVIETIRRAPGTTLDLRSLGVPGLAQHDLHDAAARRAAIDAILAAIKYLPPAERDALTLDIAARAGVVALPDDLMLQPAQVRALHRAGMQIGAHTASHPILARLEDAHARDEIASGRSALESLIDAPVSLFAYPNGKPGVDYSEANVAAARDAGFDAAFTTVAGAAAMASDPFQLPRFTPWDRSRLRFGARLAANLWQSRTRRRSAPSTHPIAQV